MRNLLLALLAVALAAGLWIATQGATSAPRSVVEWVRKNARPFDSTDPAASLDDLAALDSIVGDARIVGLGECTHGSREVFRMKHRIVEYLVERKGFRGFAIEANMPEAQRVNDYVLTGEGDPCALIRGMYFWTWQTEEVLAMVEWMRAYNASGRGPVQFLGFDMQTPDTAFAIVRRFVDRVEPAYLDSLDATWRAVVRSRPAVGHDRSAAAWAHAAAARNVTHLMSSMSHGALWAYDAEFIWALRNARIVEQATLMNTANRMSASSAIRDSCMAANVDAIVFAAPQERIVLWAHNSHVSRAPGYMGEHLHRHYGKGYVVFGFSTARGNYRAWNHGVHEGNPLTAPSAMSLENALVRAGPPRFFLDLRRANGTRDVADWLAQYRPMRGIGARTTLDQFRHSRVGTWYDAIVWIDSTSSAVPMQWSAP